MGATLPQDSANVNRIIGMQAPIQLGAGCECHCERSEAISCAKGIAGGTGILPVTPNRQAGSLSHRPLPAMTIDRQSLPRTAIRGTPVATKAKIPLYPPLGKEEQEGASPCAPTFAPMLERPLCLSFPGQTCVAVPAEAPFSVIATSLENRGGILQSFGDCFVADAPRNDKLHRQPYVGASLVGAQNRAGTRPAPTSALVVPPAI